MYNYVNECSGIKCDKRKEDKKQSKWISVEDRLRTEPSKEVKDNE